MADTYITKSDVEEAGKLGRASTAAADRKFDLTIGTETVPVILDAHGQVSIPKEAIRFLDERQPTPRYREGESTHSELSSLIAHIKRNKDADSVVFADGSVGSITAIYDYNLAGSPFVGKPRWGSHRAVYTCPPSVQWKKWFGIHGKPMKQVAFGDFLEDNLADLAGPDSATGVKDAPSPGKVLDVARNLTVMVGGMFESKIDRSTGEKTLVQKTEHGEASTKVPKLFLIGIPIYEGGTVYELGVRLRFEIAGGGAVFTAEIVDHEKALRTAFADSWKQVQDDGGIPVFLGTPE